MLGSVRAVSGNRHRYSTTESYGLRSPPRQRGVNPCPLPTGLTIRLPCRVPRGRNGRAGDTAVAGLLGKGGPM